MSIIATDIFLLFIIILSHLSRMESFPNEILLIILSFLDMKGCIAILQVSKNLRTIMEQYQSKWKELCLHRLHRWGSVWRFPKLIRKKLEIAQNESGKDWQWFAMNLFGRYMINSYSVTIGAHADDMNSGIDAFCVHISSSYIDIGIHRKWKTLNDYGKRIADSWKYEGYFRRGYINGTGIMIYNNLEKYEGPFKDSQPSNEQHTLHGYASITYPDGFKCTSYFANGEPGFFC